MRVKTDYSVQVTGIAVFTHCSKLGAIWRIYHDLGDGANMRLEPPWRALLFTHCSIEFPVFPGSLSSHCYAPINVNLEGGGRAKAED